MRCPVRLSASLLCLLAACGPARPSMTVDLVAPTLVSAEPSGGAVPVDASFVLTFSEPVKRSSVYWDDGRGREFADSIAIVKAEDEAYIVSAVNNPPISDTQRKKTVAAAALLSDDRTSIELAPVDPLEGDTDYALVVSRKIADDANNKLLSTDSRTNETVVVHFHTGAEKDGVRPKVELHAPASASTGVPLDLEAFEVSFSEPMRKNSWGSGAIVLREVETDELIVPSKGEWAGDVLRLSLPSRSGEGCSHLCRQHSYQLVANDDMTDEAGNHLVPVDGSIGFVAAACADSAAPRIDEGRISVVASDTAAVVSWFTDEPASSSIEWTGCGGGCSFKVTDVSPPCSADVCALPGAEGDFACAHTVKVTGLEPQTTYGFTLVATDGGGRRTSVQAADFQTLAPLPKIVINELFATPQGLSDANVGKFVELFNAGSDPVDLADWVLTTCADTACQSLNAANDWKLEAAVSGGSTVLDPGAYAVVHGDKFDPSIMGVPAGALRMKGETTTVLRGKLTSSVVYRYALLSPSAPVPVSTYLGHLGTPNASARVGHSFERLDARGDDVLENWSISSSSVSGAPGNFATPGSANSVMAP